MMAAGFRPLRAPKPVVVCEGLRHPEGPIELISLFCREQKWFFSSMFVPADQCARSGKGGVSLSFKGDEIDGQESVDNLFDEFLRIFQSRCDRGMRTPSRKMKSQPTSVDTFQSPIRPRIEPAASPASLRCAGSMG